MAARLQRAPSRVSYWCQIQEGRSIWACAIREHFLWAVFIPHISRQITNNMQPNLSSRHCDGGIDMWLFIYALALAVSVGACTAAVFKQPKEDRSQQEM
jgi:hypothetical protein